MEERDDQLDGDGAADDRITGLLAEAISRVRADEPPAAAEQHAVERALSALPRRNEWSVRRRRVAWVALAASLVGVAWVGLTWRNGVRVAERTGGDGQGATLPSPFHANDDVQYFPPGPESHASRASADAATQPSHASREFPKFLSVTTDPEGDSVVEPPFTAATGLPRDVTDRAHGPGATTGMSLPGGFATDLDIPFRQDSLTAGRPALGELDPASVNEANGDGYHLEARGGASASDPAGVTTLGERVFSTNGPPPIVHEGRNGERTEQLVTSLDSGGEGRGFGPHRSDYTTENYARIHDNPFLQTSRNPVSTFSTDVDTASYSNVRRFLSRNTLPPPDAVRIEELINYFPYDYAPPADGTPFAVHTEVVGCPWQPAHRLLRVGIKGRVVADEERKAGNLVFLLDVSGSMDHADKLPLVKSALALLVERLTENDRVAIVVYAGAAGQVLPSTTGDRKQEILAAIEQLHAGGSTNGGAGIHLAYELAVGHFIQGGVNRVILCTDGDFNVGVSGQEELERLITEKAASGVFLSVLGFGEGNLQDAKMEGLADQGNGNYAYIDGLREARKVFVEQLSGTLETIAKDVKIQIEFNPAQVAGYRLIGYENRLLRTEDFNDDAKDAGEIGAGHTVTALYEIVPVVPAANDNAAADLPRREDEVSPEVEPLKYQVPAQLSEAAGEGELLTLRLRYKQPDGATSVKREYAVRDGGTAYGQASVETRFAAAVAGFGMLLRQSPHRGTLTWPAVQELAQEGLGSDPHGYRAEFVDLVRAAGRLYGQ